MPAGSLHFVYYTDPDPGPTSVDLGQARVRLAAGIAAGLESSAETGETSIGSIDIDDPAGTLEVTGLHSLYVTENSAPSGSHRMWTGIVADRTYRRGEGDSLISGAARRISVSLTDHNEILGRRVISDTDGNRPAETIAERLAWLLASDYLSLVTDQGLVYYPTDDLDPNDYRSQTPAQVLSDMAAVVGYIFFAKHNESSGTPELAFFDPNDVSIYASSSRFTNVLADVDDSTTFAMTMDSELRRTPEAVYSGVYFTYSGGSTYRTRAATATAFGGWRDTTTSMTSVKTLALANKVADRYLATLASEADRLTWSAFLPADHVNDVYEGQVCQYFATHHANELGADYVNVRVLRRTVMQDKATDAFYTVRYEGVPIKAAVIQQAFGSEQGGRYAIAEFDDPPVEGDLLIAFVATSGSLSAPGEPIANPGLPAWTRIDWQTAHDNYNYPGSGWGIGFGAYWRRVEAGDGVDCVQFDHAADHGVWAFEVPYTADPTSSATNVLEDSPGYIHGDAMSVGPVDAGYVLGAIIWKMIDYAYGATIADGAGTETIASTDVFGDPDISSSQYIHAPWFWVGRNTAGTSVDIASWRSWWHDHGDASAYARTAAIGIAVAVPGL